jgi:hypothetical protein
MATKIPKTVQGMQTLEQVTNYKELCEWRKLYGCRLFRDSDGTAVVGISPYINPYDSQDGPYYMGDPAELCVLNFGFNQRQVLHCRNLHLYFNVF